MRLSSQPYRLQRTEIRKMDSDLAVYSQIKIQNVGVRM